MALNRRRLISGIAIAICLSIFGASSAFANVIYIRTPSNGTIPLDVEPSDTIEVVETKIQMETGIDPSFQILTFALQILEVGHTLSFYNINRIPVTIILTIKPDSAPDSAPDPVQQSRIFSVMPNQAYADSATAIEAQGKFIEQIRNIQVDGVNLPQGSWTQTPTSILFTVGKSKAKSISITLFNGSAPVMQIDPIPVIPSEYISTVKMKPKVTYIFCSRPGHGVRVYHGFNPACPSGSSKV